MSITITFTADSAERLREQMLYILNGGDAVPERMGIIGQTGPLPGDTAKEDRPAKAFREALASKAKEAKAKRAKAPEPQPEEPYTMPEPGDDKQQPLDPNDDYYKQAEEPDEVNGDAGTLIGDEAVPLVDVLGNEALKKETIAKLGALFAAGKVKVVRNALDKYGQGAKSFPEIDASQFPAIAAALARGDIA